MFFCYHKYRYHTDAIIQNIGVDRATETEIWICEKCGNVKFVNQKQVRWNSGKVPLKIGPLRVDLP